MQPRWHHPTVDPKSLGVMRPHPARPPFPLRITGLRLNGRDPRGAPGARCWPSRSRPCIGTSETMIRFDTVRPRRLIGEKSALIENHEPMAFPRASAEGSSNWIYGDRPGEANEKQAPSRTASPHSSSRSASVGAAAPPGTSRARKSCSVRASSRTQVGTRGDFKAIFVGPCRTRLARLPGVQSDSLPDKLRLARCRAGRGCPVMYSGGSPRRTARLLRHAPPLGRHRRAPVPVKARSTYSLRPGRPGATRTIACGGRARLTSKDDVALVGSRVDQAWP